MNIYYDNKIKKSSTKCGKFISNNLQIGGLWDIEPNLRVLKEDL